MYEHHGKPLSCDQGLAFQTHTLQMILFGLSLRNIGLVRKEGPNKNLSAALQVVSNPLENVVGIHEQQ